MLDFSKNLAILRFFKISIFISFGDASQSFVFRFHLQFNIIDAKLDCYKKKIFIDPKTPFSRPRSLGVTFLGCVTVQY